MLECLNQLRELRSTDSNLRRGSTPTPSLSNQNQTVKSNLTKGLKVGTIAALIAGIIFYLHPFYFPGSGISYATDHGLLVGVYVFALFLLWPVFAIAYFVITKQRWPDHKFMQKFGPAQKAVPLLLVTYLLTLGFNSGYPHALNALAHHGFKVPSFLVPTEQQPVTYYSYSRTKGYVPYTKFYLVPSKPFKTLPFILVWLGVSWR